jgi:hypothetical protein
MDCESFDLSKMIVEDLFRARKKRRQRLADLSFEEKIEVVKKLRSVSRTARAAHADDRYQPPRTEGSS